MNSRVVFPTGTASPAAGRDRQCLTANALEGPHMLPPFNRRLPLAEEETPAEGSWIIISAYQEPIKRQQFVGWNILRPEGPGKWWQQAEGVWWAWLNKTKLRWWCWQPHNRAVSPTDLPRNSFIIQISQVKGFKEPGKEETQWCWTPNMLI